MKDKDSCFFLYRRKNIKKYYISHPGNPITYLNTTKYR